MAKKKQRIGVCHNPACPMCDVEQFFDEEQEFKCSCCPEPLDEITADSQDSDGGVIKKIPWKMIGIICGVAILVAAVIWFFLVRKSGQEPQPVTEETVLLQLNYNDISLNTGDTDHLVADITSNLEIGEITVNFLSDNPGVATVDDAGVIKANHEGSATISAFATTPNGTADTAFVHISVKDNLSNTPNTNIIGITNNVIVYSFGRYEGNLKNGIPEGNGKMYYTSRHQIAKHDTDNPPHYAEAGDVFDGSWGNGDIVSGALYNKDGIIKEKIFAPKRFNAYDLHND